MNIQELDVMNDIMQNPYVNQREIAKHTGYSIGKVNSSLKSLSEKGYLSDTMEPTKKALEEQKSKKPKNAIILAAGYGMRMVPINVEIPKGLLEIDEEPLIERIIRQLHEAEVYEIHIVVGFMKERYEYLIDKYDVNLIYNKEYSLKNNLHSLYCAARNLGNTYIVPCDIFCEKNPFSKTEWYSWYMVTDEMSENSTVRTNRKSELVLAKKGKSGNAMIGIAYLTGEDAKKVQLNACEYAKKKEYNQRFWEAALFDKEDILVGAKVMKAGDVHEINTYEQLRELDEHSDQLHSDVIELIAETLNCSDTEIENICALKKGMTNRSFEFTCRGKKYIMRIPGEGSEEMINRRQECAVYEQLKGKNISDTVLYISPDTGYKLTEYIENARNCDSENHEDVKACMDYLRAFHDCGLWVDHTFDIFEQMELYEQYRGTIPSVYKDYEQTKKKMYELKEYIDQQPKKWALTHIDANCDNFIMTDKMIRLIDWEYAGMQDVHVDIAMFAIYSLYNREQVDELIRCYFHGEPEFEVKMKVYCYIAVCGFLWSNWCEYKSVCGVEFGEYSLRQYRYAKEYYKIVKQELEKNDKSK